jgi:thiol-disulfide isomerase/thioredoxin
VSMQIVFQRGLLLAAALLLAGCGGAPNAEPADTAETEASRVPEARVGDAPAESPEPAATLETVNVSQVAALLQAARGKVVVVNFWATWCIPCVEELPHFSAFYRQHPADQVVFISLSLDPAETAAAFLKERPVPYPVRLLNDEGNVAALQQALGVEIAFALPTTVLFDKSGAHQKTWETAITREELDAAVGPLL